MPRTRASLTDKEEKILVQAQLMGLSTTSMVKIGNRLKALEKEREDIAYINDTIQGYSWPDKLSPEKLSVTTPDGYLVEAERGVKGNSRWDSFSWEYTIKVTKPGTRFKARTYKKKTLHCSYDWKKRLMPGSLKELYSLIRWCRNSLQRELLEA